jgi:hypothetical protein
MMAGRARIGAKPDALQSLGHAFERDEKSAIAKAVSIYENHGNITRPRPWAMENGE